MHDLVKEIFPFSNESLNTSLLMTVMNYLSSNQPIGKFQIMNGKTRALVEKAFMYVSSVEKDYFMISLRQVTITDLQWFEAHSNENVSLKKASNVIKNDVLYILDCLRSGCYDKLGNKVGNNVKKRSTYIESYKPTPFKSSNKIDSRKVAANDYDYSDDLIPKMADTNKATKNIENEGEIECTISKDLNVIFYRMTTIMEKPEGKWALTRFSIPLC